MTFNFINFLYFPGRQMVTFVHKIYHLTNLEEINLWVNGFAWILASCKNGAKEYRENFMKWSDTSVVQSSLWLFNHQVPLLAMAGKALQILLRIRYLAMSILPLCMLLLTFFAVSPAMLSICIGIMSIPVTMNCFQKKDSLPPIHRKFINPDTCLSQSASQWLPPIWQYIFASALLFLILSATVRLHLYVSLLRSSLQILRTP